LGVQGAGAAAEAGPVGVVLVGDVERARGGLGVSVTEDRRGVFEGGPGEEHVGEGAGAALEGLVGAGGVPGPQAPAQARGARAMSSQTPTIAGGVRPAPIPA
jgi:hypothetical protein